MEINQTAELVHNTAKEKGFWEGPRNTGELLMLVTSELSEALEADRKNRYADKATFVERFAQVTNSYTNKETDSTEDFKRLFELQIKDTFEDELADALIRILDIAASRGIDLEWHIQQKMRYNATRGYKHGKKY